MQVSSRVQHCEGDERSLRVGGRGGLEPQVPSGLHWALGIHACIGQWTVTTGSDGLASRGHHRGIPAFPAMHPFHMIFSFIRRPPSESNAEFLRSGHKYHVNPLYFEVVINIT